MAKGTVRCKCATCGAEFTMEKTCYNRAEANSFEEWAKGNCTECKDCYRKRMDAENATKSSTYDLPELTGTEKQIAYAESLRNRYVASHKEYIEEYIETMKQVTPEKLDSLISAEMPTRESVFNEFLKQYCFETEHVVMTCSSAHDVIDELKL